MFQVNGNKGFKLTFPNGITLSSQFGFGNYCNNRNYLKLIESNSGETTSSNCEVAVLNKDGSLITATMVDDLPDVFNNDDDVIGWVNMHNWLKIFEWCKNHSKGG